MAYDQLGHTTKNSRQFYVQRFKAILCSTIFTTDKQIGKKWGSFPEHIEIFGRPFTELNKLQFAHNWFKSCWVW